MLNGIESIAEVRQRIVQALADGKIRVIKDTAYFADGRVAGGLITDSKDSIVESILNCLKHGGFDGDTNF